MFTIALTISTLLLFATGLCLYLELRDKDVLIIRRNGQVKQLASDLHSVQRMLHTVTNDKQRFIIRNRLLTAQVQDLTGERHHLQHQVDGLLTQLEQLQVDHAKVVLGGTMLPTDGRGQE